MRLGFLVLTAVVAAGAIGFAQATRSAGRSTITGSWEAYPIRGEGFGSGIQPKTPVTPPKPIPEPPLRQPHLDQWRALQAHDAELTRKGLPPASSGMACAPQGMPGVMQATFPMEILETPGQVTIIQEAFNQVRRIFLDVPPVAPEDADPRFFGHSTGRSSRSQGGIASTAARPASSRARSLSRPDRSHSSRSTSSSPVST